MEPLSLSHQLLKKRWFELELKSRRCTCRNEKRVRKILVQYNFLLAKIHLVQVIFIVQAPSLISPCDFRKSQERRRRSRSALLIMTNKKVPKWWLLYTSRGVSLVKLFGFCWLGEGRGDDKLRTCRRPCRPYHPCHHPYRPWEEQRRRAQGRRRWRPQWYRGGRRHQRRRGDQCGQP